MRLMVWVAAMCAVALCAGCAGTVNGTAEPARDSAGIIGIGRSIPQILPTSKELASALRSPVADDGFPPRVGGPDVLVPGREVADNDGAECVGVTDPFLKAPYRNAPVPRWLSKGGTVSSRVTGWMQESSRWLRPATPRRCSPDSSGNGNSAREEA